VLAVVDVSDRGVNVRPVPDITAIVIGVLAVAGLALLTARGRPAADGKRLLSVLKPER
jgi:hypothetical protein